MPISVKSTTQGISIHLDKDPAIYSRGDNIVISGTDAGVSTDLNVKVLGSNNTQIVSLQISSTNRGEYSTVWKIPLVTNPGSYTILASSITGKASIGITIQ